MTCATPPRGAAPVGFIDDLNAVEAGAVLFLRLWSDGPGAQARVRRDFITALGAEHGQRPFDAFQALFEICARHGRRPLMRHDVACRCLGADESCFATVLGYASEGASEDAMLLAASLVRPDMAGALAGLAQEVGLALRRMSLIRAATPAIRDATVPVH